MKKVAKSLDPAPMAPMWKDANSFPPFFPAGNGAEAEEKPFLSASYAASLPCRVDR